MVARKILILLAHPILERSRINRQLADTAAQIEGVHVHDLYERHPSLNIHVRHEQALLQEHDVIVFQHPFYWYSTPAILKQWQDLVLEHGWAYGARGKHLVGKYTLNAVSTGGPTSAYRREGFNGRTVREFLAPYEHTARLCGMTFLAPFVVPASHRLDTPEQVKPHAEKYRQLLLALREDRLDVEQASHALETSETLERLIRPASSAGVAR